MSEPDRAPKGDAQQDDGDQGVVAAVVEEVIEPVRSTTGLVVGILFLLLATAAVAVGVQALLAARASASWPTTEGTVVESRIEQTVKGNSPSPYYHGVVTYGYEFDGRSYEANRYSFSGMKESPERMVIARIIARYPKGAAVTVHYDPDDPAAAVLVPGGSQYGWLFIVAGGFCAAMGGLILVARATAS